MTHFHYVHSFSLTFQFFPFIIFLLVLTQFNEHRTVAAKYSERRKPEEAVEVPQIMERVSFLLFSRWFVLTAHYLFTFKERRVYKNPTEVLPLKTIISIKSAEE